MKLYINQLKVELDLDDRTNFGTLPTSTWYNRKHLLFLHKGIIDPTDWNTFYRTVEYVIVYFFLSLENDHVQLVISPWRDLWNSEGALLLQIDKKLPGEFLLSTTIGYQEEPLGVYTLKEWFKTHPKLDPINVSTVSPTSMQKEKIDINVENLLKNLSEKDLNKLLSQLK